MKSDFELLDAWAEGNRSAGDELIRRHALSLKRFFRNKLGDEVEDVIQDTLLACVEGRSRFRRDSSFRTYMFSTAKHILFREWRRRGKNQNFDPGVTSVVDSAISASSVSAARQEHRLLLEALRRIPLDHQVTLELYFWEDLTGPELASILDIKEPAARGRIRRAREQLQAQMEAIAQSGEELTSTLTNLERWAQEVREQVSTG